MHGMRHTFVTIAFDNGKGASIKAIAKHVGHDGGTRVTESIYTHLDEGASHSVVAHVSEVLNRNRKTKSNTS